jgi:RNA polymerase sigma-70 factor (ECF subfamily)
MRELTLTDMERLGAFDEADRTFQMTEDAFRSFYELTARPVRVYLARMVNDERLADDLLQETYYRFLRSTVVFENDDHRRRYLYRIATNLVHDHRRRPHVEVASTTLPERHPAFTEPNVAERAARRIDLQRALARLKPRERSMLWLAYALGWSHQEIAASIGVKTGSLKPMLHRARQRLSGLLNPSTRGSRSGGPPATRSGQGRS